MTAPTFNFSKPTRPTAHKPLELDGVTFTLVGPDQESASRDGVIIGECELDEVKMVWRARRMIDGEFGLWVPMRSEHEARAYLVSLDGTAFWTAREVAAEIAGKVTGTK